MIDLTKIFYSILIPVFLTFGTNISLLKAQQLSFGIGAGLWQEQIRYVNTFELSILYEFQDFKYEIQLPFFIPFDSRPFIWGVPNKELSNMFAGMSDLVYLSAFVKELSYDKKSIQVGFKQHFFHFDRTLIWGNPLFYSKTPFIGPNFYFQIDNSDFSTGFFTSSLQDPSLMVFLFDVKPFSKSHILWLKELNIKTSFYADFPFKIKRPVDLFQKAKAGSGLNIKTLYWENKPHALGFQVNASYGNYLLRSSAALLYRILNKLSFTEIGLGVIGQDKNHPTSPLLSSLSPGFANLQEISFHSSEYIAGGTFFFKWSKKDSHSLSFDLDTYPSLQPMFSYRINYSLHWEEVQLQLSFIRDKIISFKEAVVYWDKNAFWGFNLKATIIDGLFEIGWSLYLNRIPDKNLGSTLKSKIYTHFIF